MLPLLLLRLEFALLVLVFLGLRLVELLVVAPEMERGWLESERGEN